MFVESGFLMNWTDQETVDMIRRILNVLWDSFNELINDTIIERCLNMERTLY